MIRNALAALALAAPLTATPPATEACFHVLYEHRDYQGSYRVVQSGQIVNMDAYFNNRASSLRVGCSSVVLAAGFGMSGRQEYFPPGVLVRDLAVRSFNDQTSSVYGYGT